MSKNVLLCGVGGQGTVLSSKLLAAAAMAKGIPVLTAETIGMAQRGGSVTSHLRMGENMYSPLIGKGQADLLLAFEPGEAVRNLPYLKKGGIVVTNTRPVRPVTGTLTGVDYTGMEMVDFLKAKARRVIVVDGDQAAADLSSSRVLNVVLLGAAVESGVLAITKEDIRAAILAKIAPRFHELNMRAIDYIKTEENENHEDQ
ncbi:MAG: indolepyruvate oxidoreductase subunit beta [Clostridiales bacterium]|nr:indolepyruvate oxidoreductase subunit beta [Clostridiales bacterium]